MDDLKRVQRIAARLTATDSLGDQLKESVAQEAAALLAKVKLLEVLAANMKQDAQVIKRLAQSKDVDELARGLEMVKQYSQVLKELK